MSARSDGDTQYGVFVGRGRCVSQIDDKSVHLLLGQQHTLCGNTLMVYPEPADAKVTCEFCLRIVESCKEL